MTTGRFRFDRFMLDRADRRLWQDGTAVDINARYLDALTLLVSDHGKLITKDRFLAEVWRGVPVTDEALTQCIKSLRRLLGDDAARPRFIETVPKHGYRFIGDVAADGAENEATEAPVQPAPSPSRDRLLLAAAGTIGGGAAGIVGGLAYGLAGASQPLAPDMGTVSVLLVLLWLTTMMALIGAAGVSLGIVMAGFGRRDTSPWMIVGGAVGGMMVGAVVKLLGLDAFNLLFGAAPQGITGGIEGAGLGAAVGCGAWLAGRRPSAPIRGRAAVAGLVGALGGLAIAAAGGRLMGGSLDLLARQFPQSRLRLDPISGPFGEGGFGPVSQILTAGVEGALFAAGIVAALLLARRRLDG